jgi:hypothetical protein
MQKISPILGDITNELLEYMYKQIKKKNNKKRLKYIINSISDFALNDLKPYLYTILTILILMFLMNCLNFYYYTKLFMKTNPDTRLN